MGVTTAGAEDDVERTGLSALKLFIPATIRVMYSRTAADRRKIGRALDAGDGASVGSGWLAGNGFDCSMYSSL